MSERVSNPKLEQAIAQLVREIALEARDNSTDETFQLNLNVLTMQAIDKILRTTLGAQEYAAEAGQKR